MKTRRFIHFTLKMPFYEIGEFKDKENLQYLIVNQKQKITAPFQAKENQQHLPQSPTPSPPQNTNNI